MTAKADSISSDHFRPSNFARNLQYTTNPLHHSFNNSNAGKRILIFLTALAVTIGVVLVLFQIYGSLRANKSLNATNSSETTTSSYRQPLKGTGRQTMTNETSNSGSSTSNGPSSNTNSTSVSVNGQPVAVPQSGSYDKTIKVAGGNVHISGNSSQSTSSGGSATNSSSTNVEINSQ